MTEQTFPTGGTALAEPPLPTLPLDGGDSEDPGNRRKLLLVGVVLAVLVLAIAAYFLLLKGDSSTPTSSGSPVTPAAAAPVKPHKAHVAKPVALPKHFKGHVGRDPFNPLYTAPVAAPAAPSGTTGGSTTTDGSTPTTTDGSTPTTTDGSTPTTTHKAVYRPIWIQLRKVTAKSVVFAIGYSNNKNLRVSRFVVDVPKHNGQTLFANRFSLLSVSGEKVMLKYGDGSPFLLDLQHNTMIVN